MPVHTALPQRLIHLAFSQRIKSNIPQAIRGLYEPSEMCAAAAICPANTIYCAVCINTEYRNCLWASCLLQRTAGDILASDSQRDCWLADWLGRNCGFIRQPVVVAIVVVVVEGNNV